MTLDDFFTLSEMDNGLASPSRVNELISAMQKEKDSVTKNSADLSRQRSAVASVIAATENKDCHDLFLQLDGLHFISNWLKDAQMLSNDTTDTFVEDLIAHLLQALKNLNVDYEKSVASEILTAVENLVDHSNSRVQDKARVLLESWKKTNEKPEAVTGDVARTTSSDFTRVLLESWKKTNEKPEALTGDVARDELTTSSDLARVLLESWKKTNEKPEAVTGDVSRDELTASSDIAVCRDEIKIADEPNKSLDGPTEEERPIDRVSSPSSPKPTVDPTITDDVAVAETKSVTELSSEKKSCDEGLSSVDSMRAVDSSVENQCGNLNKEGGGDTNGLILPKPFSNEKSWGKFLSGIRDDVSDRDGDLKNNNYSFGKKQIDRESDRAGMKPDVEIDYGIVDPLEVAMLVAMEVEREVVDYKEQSCSSSEKKEKLPETNKREPDSPGSVSGKRSNASDEGANDSNSNSSDGESETSSENLDTNGTQDAATSQVTEAAAQEEEKKSPRKFFDLNEELFSEDHDHRPANQFSTPVSIVSASRASAADPKLPCAPLQFEGNLGWKGSALTSAFRPASPRRVPESDISSGSSSKQRQVGFCLDFDLNVTESIDESSLETNSSKRSEHLELDLNRTSEDGGGSHLLDWRIGNLFRSNQPVRNNIIDLNDQPSLFLNNANKASQNFNVSGSGINNLKSNNDSTISIMGTRVEIDRKDLVSQSPSLQNGRNLEPSFEYNLGRTGNFVGIGSAIPYTHYGYNNIAHGPVMPFSGPMYGPGQPIPYMVDSRGAPVIPQMMGSSSSLPAGFSQQPFSQQPFVINMNGQMASNGVGPSRGSFDLNSGMLMESGSKDPSGLGLFLNSSQARSVDQPNPQVAMSSAVSGKRKEPDNGYNDHYYPYKHFTPQWKQS